MWQEYFPSYHVAFTAFEILILTQSTVAPLTRGVVLLMMLVLRWKWGWDAIPFSLMAVGGMIALLGVDKILQILSSGMSEEGLVGRLEVWLRAIYMIQDFPITGIGLGVFMEAADNMYPLFLNDPGSVSPNHNLFLQITVNLGIPGLIGWLAIL